MQLSLLDASNRTVVAAPPIVVCGLRSLGCEVIASTGFPSQLPLLVARHQPDSVVLHVDEGAEQLALDVLPQVRLRCRSALVMAVLPTPPSAVMLEQLDALQVVVALRDADEGRMRELLGLEGVPVADAPRLTPRELAVLRLAAEGLTNRVIARRLDLSENTVKNHLRHVHAKFEVRSRTEAVMAAVRAGYSVIPRS